MTALLAYKPCDTFAEPRIDALFETYRPVPDELAYNVPLKLPEPVEIKPVIVFVKNNLEYTLMKPYGT